MNLIVAVDENWGIGLNGDLLVKIPEDTAFFRQATTGKVVVMGHRTFRSLPGAKPLKDRTNIVLSKDRRLTLDGAVVRNSIADLNALLQEYPSEDVYIIGGQTLYEQMLRYCQAAYVTRVSAPAHLMPDRFFPNLDSAPGWVLENRSEPRAYKDMRYTFDKYVNLNPRPLKDAP